MEETLYIPTISLCMIVKDEEGTLGRCLETVKDLVDEIIIVDTGSVDKTKEIAKSYTDKIFNFKWSDDFAAARNFSFEQATMDYILWLDADDVISESERKKFQNFKKQFPRENDIIFMQYATAYNSENISISTRRERLIRRALNVKWIGKVHEVLNYDSKAAKILVEIIITHKKEKAFSDRNIKIYEKTISSGEKLQPRDLYHYGKELMAHGFIEKAIKVFEEFLKTSFIDPSFHSAICIDIVDCYYQLGKKDKCMEYCSKSFDYGIPRAEITSRLGQLFFEKQDFETSIFWSNLSLQLPLPRGGSPILHSAYTWQPHLTLCSCYSTLNEFEQADYHFQKAFELAPNEPLLLKYKEQYENFKDIQKGNSKKTEEENSFTSPEKDVNWEGSFFINHSLALVNREICKRLIAAQQYEIGIIPYEEDPDFPLENNIKEHFVLSDNPSSITIRHQWPPNFNKPKTGKLILFQPWEFGAIPRAWFIPMKHWIDELWVYSTYNKECYVRSGIPEHKVKVVPLGVDGNIFHFDVKPLPLKSEKSFHFLFVGGTIFRKGIDTLLQAYLAEFSADDDVSLVIKDFGGDSFYKGQTAERTIAEIGKDPKNPTILYMNEELSPNDLAGLYKACDCLVHPYRGEGFGLPIIESMACGTPAIVPSLGPVADFCDSDTAFIISSQEETYPHKKLGEVETILQPWWVKINQEELRRIMRFVYENQELLVEKGQKASQHILTTFTWAHTANQVSSLLQQILNKENLSNTNSQEIIKLEIIESAKLVLSQKMSLEQSFEILKSLLDVYPHSISTRYYMTLFYLNANDFKSALMHLLYINNDILPAKPEGIETEIISIIEEQPETFYSEVWNFIGICYKNQKEWDKAVEAFRKGIGKNPRNLEKVIEIYQNLIQESSNGTIPLNIVDLYNDLGTLYVQMKNGLQAKAMFEKALKTDASRFDIQDKLDNVKKHLYEYYIKAQKSDYELLWQSPVFNLSGYAEEQKLLLESLKRYPLKIRVELNDFQSKPDYHSKEILSYIASLQKNELAHPFIHYQALPAYAFTPPRAPISIGRTMFETDSLPQEWLEKMKHLTEIWVPSEFNKQTFADAGLNQEKIFVLPGAIDAKRYNPEQVKPYDIGDNHSFKFLSVFDWSVRKGWDILIQSYFEEFKESDDVLLIIKTSKILHPNANPHNDIMELVNKLGIRSAPRVLVIDTPLTPEEMIQLYAAADAFVLPSRGEGWGYPYMEAMTMGLPTIGTRWSGQLGFMDNKNSYLIDIDGIVPVDQRMPPFFHGHNWAQPSVTHLRTLMKGVYEDRHAAKLLGSYARQDMLTRFSKEKAAQLIYSRMIELVKCHFE